MTVTSDNLLLTAEILKFSPRPSAAFIDFTRAGKFLPQTATFNNRSPSPFPPLLFNNPGEIMSHQFLAPKTKRSSFGGNFQFQQKRKRKGSDDDDEWRPELVKIGRTPSKLHPKIVPKRLSEPLSPEVITLDDIDDNDEEMEIDIPLTLETVGEDPLMLPSCFVPAEDIVNGILDFTNVVDVPELPVPIIEFNFAVPNLPKRVARLQKKSVASVNIPKFLKAAPKISKSREIVSKAEIIKSTTPQLTTTDINYCNVSNPSKAKETVQKTSISRAALCKLRQDLHLSDDESSEESESDEKEEKNDSEPETREAKTESKTNHQQQLQQSSPKNAGKSFPISANTVSASFKIIHYRGKVFRIGQKKPRECPHCFKEFANDILLANHAISVHTPTVHHCHKCSITFGRPMELHRHIVSNHPMRHLTQTV